MALIFEAESSASLDTTNIYESTGNCLFFFYFFLGCYIFCVVFLLYTLLRLVKSYLRQKYFQTLSHELIEHSTATVLIKISNLNDEELKCDMNLLQPLIIRTENFPPLYQQTPFSLPPPAYQE